MMVRSGPAAAAARVHRMRTMEMWAAETTDHWPLRYGAHGAGGDTAQ